MIRVNLLPVEYRKAESTPAKQLLATVGAASLAVVAGLVWAIIYSRLSAAQQELASLTDDVNSQQAALQQLKDLRDTAREYRTRYENIEKVAQDRLILSQKLDQLWEVLVNPPAGRYEVWIKDLTVQVQAGGGRIPTGGSAKFSGISAGPALHKLQDFHETLVESEFFQDFDPRTITQPYGNREALSTDREPSEGWRFDWTMYLKPLKTIYEDRAKAKQGTAK